MTAAGIDTLEHLPLVANERIYAMVWFDGFTAGTNEAKVSKENCTPGAKPQGLVGDPIHLRHEGDEAGETVYHSKVPIPLGLWPKQQLAR